MELDLLCLSFLTSSLSVTWSIFGRQQNACFTTNEVKLIIFQKLTAVV